MHETGERPADVRDCILAAFRYWEPKRLIYNLVLAAVTVAISIQEIVGLFNAEPLQVVGFCVVMAVFCVLANICYCAAYVPDVILQLTPLSDIWKRFRWVLFTSGTAIACGLVVFLFYMPHDM